MNRLSFVKEKMTTEWHAHPGFHPFYIFFLNVNRMGCHTVVSDRSPSTVSKTQNHTLTNNKYGVQEEDMGWRKNQNKF